MGVEAGALKEQDKKKKEISEKQKLQVEKGISSIKDLRNKENKEDTEENENLESDIDEFLGLVEKGVLTKESADKIMDGVDLSSDEIQEIFEKIDQMEDIKDIDKYLPAELRVTKEDYSKAMSDDIFRVQIITKLDSALTLIANQINPDSSMGLNLFSGFLTVLDKNLITVQENTIDVKYSLKEIDEKKFGKKEDNRSVLEKIIDFMKELFS